MKLFEKLFKEKNKKVGTVVEQSEKNSYDEYLLGNDDITWSLNDYSIHQSVLSLKLEIDDFIATCFEKEEGLDEANIAAFDKKIQASKNMALNHLNAQYETRFLGIEKMAAIRNRDITLLNEKEKSVIQRIEEHKKSLLEDEMKMRGEQDEKEYDEK